MFNVLTIGFKMVTDLGILSKGYKDQLLCNHKSFCPEEQLNFLQHGIQFWQQQNPMINIKLELLRIFW